jgi:hypothetical protein
MGGRPEVWIGLISVTPRPGSQELPPDRGAYVNALAIASSRWEFIDRVREALLPLHLQLEEAEDVEPFSVRLASHVVDEDLRQLANDMSTTTAVRFGTFHTFPLQSEQ